MKVTMFVVEASPKAAKPGEKVNQLTLQLAPRDPDKIDDENAAVFPNANRRSCGFSSTGLCDSAVQEFTAGQRVTVTITPEP